MSTIIDLADIAVGFADPVFDSQAVFRSVLDALSRPGRIVTVDSSVEAPLPHFEAAAAVALTMLDFETPVFVDSAFHVARVDNWLRFHCGCPVTEQPPEAAFAFVAAETMPQLAAFNAGDPKYPDRSTTVIILCEALSGGAEQWLEGPGIETQQMVAPIGLPEDFWEQMTENRADFQLGVDVILAADTAIIGLPRSTRIVNKKD
jgi:alpha-D-ribose 1-methylphosphonate 5-triphosphate synthase subunit PhnH